MAMNRIGLLVAFAFALHASAALVPFRAAAPARQTDGAELLEKSANGISPVPTSLSKSDLAEMELFRRYDYVLPSSICGWHWYTDMAISFACYESTATAACINIGNYRGCCYGATTDCASAFMTSCIPFGSITVSGSTEQCGSLRTCCSESYLGDCVTLYYSFSTDDYSKTYTELNCGDNGGRPTTFHWQDYPPTDGLLASATTPPSSSSASASSSVTSSSQSTPTPNSAPTQTDDPKPVPVGAIAGGAVGGLAVIVIGAVVLGVVYIKHRARKAEDPPPPPPPQQADAYGSYKAEMAGSEAVKGPWSPELVGSGGRPVRFVEAMGSPVGDGRRAELG